LLPVRRRSCPLQGWSWKHICEKIGGTSPVLLVGALLGQMKLTKPQAANAAELFGLSKAETALLNEVPMRGSARITFGSMLRSDSSQTTGRTNFPSLAQ
jgi:cyanate lyase